MLEIREAPVQLAKELGVEIFATAGTDEKVSLAQAHGAHHGINYTAAKSLKRAGTFWRKWAGTFFTESPGLQGRGLSTG